MEKEYLESGNLKIWEIYWFDRTWLSENSSKEKGDYRPCIVIFKSKKQLVLIPMSSTATTLKWNIEYNSATRRTTSNIHIDNLRILDPRSLKNSKRCKTLLNMRSKNKINARISSKKLKKEILVKTRDILENITG